MNVVAIITSFEQFHDNFSKYNYQDYIFRGVKKVNYELKPKVARYSKYFKTISDLYNFEEDLWTLFKKFSKPYLSFEPKNIYEWLAIAQHHGLPTRLLDWTKNPMVAAYFAVHDENKSCEDCAIYILKTTNLRQVIEDENDSPFEIDEPMLYIPSHISSRIITQNGIFTVSNNLENSLDELLPNSQNIEKVIISKSFKKQLKTILDRYGINKATLFPGLDGISEYLEWHLINNYKGDLQSYVHAYIKK